jgi:hypothetical protein
MQMWASVYEALLERAPETALFICYETLCGETERVWPALCTHLGLPQSAPAEPLRAPATPEPADDPETLQERCRGLYARLRHRAI